VEDRHEQDHHALRVARRDRPGDRAGAEPRRRRREDGDHAVTGAPRYSVSEITTFRQTFEEDLATYREGGAQGIGIWEFKLGDDPAGDADAVAKLRDSGLEATTCIPGTLSIYPVPFPGADDPAERVPELCAAIERFAAFDPAVVRCLTGYPGDTPPTEARRTVVEGLRRAAKVAGERGIVQGREPLQRELYGHWST